MSNFFGSEKYKKVMIAFAITLGVTIVTFAVIFISYTQKLKSTSDMGLVTSNSVNNIVSNDEEDSTLTSTSEDADVNEAMNEALASLENTTNETSVQGETIDTTTTDNVENVETSEDTANTEEVEAVEEPEPVSFIAPVSGEIIVDYANESLIYSETLQEWTTHLGIDIKADKASVVVASEDGVVKSIKNDPRYGLTITISHNENFETVYSNLLSSEFVNEGDTVTQGQTIGTVGESASFEVAEVPHLHFEMYKDGEVVNPTLYLSE